MYRAARASRIYDGPDEVHRMTVARHVLRDYRPVEVPTESIPVRRRAAEERFQAALEALSLNS
jgi:acyl-CoA dehydrogenase